MRFEVFMAVRIQVEVFWIVTLFWRTLLPPSSGWILHGVTTQKTLTWRLNTGCM